MIILNGASYEQWLKNVSVPPSKLVNTTAGLSDRLIPLAKSTMHSHELEREHEHSGTAFSTWLDMSLAVEQVGAITVALSAPWPGAISGRFLSIMKTNIEALKIVYRDS